MQITGSTALAVEVESLRYSLKLAEESMGQRIKELEALLRRIDDVTVWETHPLGRGIQEEIEAALGVGEKQSR